MKAHVIEFPVKKMSEVFEVSKSGYYKWLRKQVCYRAEERVLHGQIQAVFEESRSTYGSPRVHQQLVKMEVKISKSTVARRMKSLQIRPRAKKVFKHTTDSGHDLRISPNVLNRAFSASELGRSWVSDITYIRVKHSFVYLTTVIDLADRMVVGWNLSDNMTDQDTVIAAFKKAVRHRPIRTGLIFHSDRGSQYASTEFRKCLAAKKCVQSMSRKGNCWDNAVAESFFKTIKVEALYRHQFEHPTEVYSAVFDYIDGWYNTRRIHSALDGRSPTEMANWFDQKKVA